MDLKALVCQLIDEEGDINRRFVTGEITRDAWAKSLEELESRLNVLGFALVNRPWDKAPSSAGSVRSTF